MSRQQCIAKTGLIFFVLLLTACKSAPVYNIQEASFPLEATLSLTQAYNAILSGTKKAGWVPKSIGSNRIKASYSSKGNRYSAVVIINFDTNSYDITYQSSHNLKFKKVLMSSNSDTEDFIKDNNPFQKAPDNPEFQSLPDTSIHVKYNEWIALLKQEIDIELNSLNHPGSQKPAKSRSAAASEATCSDTPSTYLSGRATIRKNRVNLRSGSSTTCNILGVVKKTESFSLLGQKDNWYYVALDYGQNAWIYAPLVQRSTTQLASAETTRAISADKPKPPAVPTKKIRIAVIHFKTLNKEAQDISLGELVSEVFTSVLVNSNNFKIIEREQLEKVVSEIEMNETGFIETTDAVEIGKMLQADAIVTGSVALLADQIQLNARIIEINSAFVISADSKTTKYSLKNINQITSEIVYRFSQKLINANAS